MTIQISTAGTQTGTRRRQQTNKQTNIRAEITQNGNNENHIL